MKCEERQYIAIDLKSFYASVECVERGLNPLDVCLVVADASRTDKTICLAVSPTLKSFGIGGRPRLFEVIQRVRDVNRTRGSNGKSVSGAELQKHPDKALDYIIAPPRMALYIDYSTRVYNVYLRYIAPEDIHVYSIDEVFIDATAYLKTYGISAHDLAMRMIRDVLAETGVTATAGIGSNMYLCKVAMDIVAKKMPPDADGVRIAALSEMEYRQKLWNHTPITDFWRVGSGVAGRLARYGMYTMGDVARCSIAHEDLLYSLFGVNAELLIDHAWGWEPVTMDKVKSYRPAARSISSGQVLTCAYTFEKARNVAMEMADSVALDLIAKGLVSENISLDVGYDTECISNSSLRSHYDGRIVTDCYGRPMPKPVHGGVRLERHTSSAKMIMNCVAELFDHIVNPHLLVRRITITLCGLLPEGEVRKQNAPVQLDLFTDYSELKRRRQAEEAELRKEHRRQKVVLLIKKRFGKNAILRGMNYAEGAMQRERNVQIGGHKA